MRLPLAIAVAWLGAASTAVAAAAPLPVQWQERSADGRQTTWHATLDLRELPAGTVPAAVTAVVTTAAGPQATVAPRLAIALNGLVVARGRAAPDGRTELHAEISGKVLSTRNHLAVAATLPAAACGAGPCDLRSAGLSLSLDLEPGAARMPDMSFASLVSRFGTGIAIQAASAGERRLGERAARAVAPHAPRLSQAAASIVVSRTTPQGTRPALRFDRGPVEIRDADGRTLYDQRRLEALTIVQATSRGATPVLWIRPGRDGPPPTLDLDYGTLALFGRDGREIAFAPGQDRAATVIYAAEARQDARFALTWRLAVLAAWLAATVGFALVLRRIPRLEPKAA